MTIFGATILVLSFMATMCLAFYAGMRVADKYHEQLGKTELVELVPQERRRKIEFSPAFTEKFNSGERATERVQ